MLPKLEQTHLNLPQTFYVRFKPISRSGMRAMMTPDGDDSKACRYKAAIDSWARWPLSRSEPLPARTITNEPLVGFRLTGEGSHTNNGSVEWIVEDPRGFTVAVTTLNASQLTQSCSIVQGEILEECVWAAFASHNILIPTSGVQYQNAVRNTGRMNKRVSLRKLKVGNHVVTVDGLSGVYLGTYYPITKASQTHTAEVCRTKRAVLAVFEDGSHIPKSLQLIAALKVSEITKSEEKTKAGALEELNSYIAKQGLDCLCFPAVVGFTGAGNLQSQSVPCLDPIEYDDIAALRDDCIIVVKLQDGTFGMCHSFQIKTTYTNDVLVRSYLEAPIIESRAPSHSYSALRILKADLRCLDCFRISNHITTLEGFEIDLFY
jgi:hypothetical protein